MSEPLWVSLKSALALHERSIELFGGSPGIRDEGLLQSALDRPRNVNAYEPESTLHRLAAAYGHGIAMNHPFVDGNKRTAFAVCGVFLAKNGLWLSASEPDAAGAVIAVAAGQLSEREFEVWLAANTVSLKGT